MKFNKTKEKFNFTITILIIIGILIVVNFLSYQLFYRWDLTQNKDYSISSVSKETVRNLDDIVNIKIYFSDNLPKQYITLKQEVNDILEEYQSYADKNIKIEYINPDSLENTEMEMYRLGIPALQFNVLEKDKYESIRGYLGMIIEYGGKKEVIPVVESTENLEYQASLAIKKVISDEIATIGFVSSNGTVSTDEEITFAYRKIQELYNTQKVDLSSESEIPSSINTLVIIGPEEEFSEEQLKKIDEFFMRGGSILIAADGIKVEEGLVPTPNNIGLNSLLDKYGLSLNQDLVLDRSAGMASFTSGYMTFNVQYPLWPKVLKSGFCEDNASVAKLESVIMPWASSINVNEANIDEGNNISYLIKSSNNSWLQTENYNLDPQQDFNIGTNRGSKNLAVSIFGKFNSAYGEGSTDSGRLVLIGDSDFIYDGFVRQSPDNLTLFQNLVDILSFDEDLINIRSKGVTDRPIKDLDDSEKALIRYLNVFGITLLVILFGMVRYYLRKRSKFVDEL